MSEQKERDLQWQKKEFEELSKQVEQVALTTKILNTPPREPYVHFSFRSISLSTFRDPHAKVHYTHLASQVKNVDQKTSHESKLITEGIDDLLKKNEDIQKDRMNSEWYQKVKQVIYHFCTSVYGILIFCRLNERIWR